MKKIIPALFFFFSLSVLTDTATASEKNWKLVIDNHGVQVYKDTTRGIKHRMYKAVTTIDASMESIMNILLDVEKYPEWLPGCSFSEKKTDKNLKNNIVHIGLNIPWPMQNRDFIVTTKVENDLKNGFFFVEQSTISRSDEFEAPDGFNRMLFLYGKFEGELISTSQTRMTFYLILNPGGRIGSIMSNRFTGRFAKSSMTGLAVKAKKQ